MSEENQIIDPESQFGRLEKAMSQIAYVLLKGSLEKEHEDRLSNALTTIQILSEEFFPVI